jgi:hypothetical protein
LLPVERGGFLAEKKHNGPEPGKPDNDTDDHGGGGAHHENEMNRSRVLMPKNTAERTLAQFRPRLIAHAIQSHRPIAIRAPVARGTARATSA